MNDADTQGFSYDDLITSETPFDPNTGIWFKYGRNFLDREKQIHDFEACVGVKLPDDFLAFIGEKCEGGFDGWYQVRKDESGRLVWTHLLLMKLPDSVDEETDREASPEGRTHITTRLIAAERCLFYRGERLHYLPFGTANLFQQDCSGTEGYLAFDTIHQMRVVFLHENESTPSLVADSFTAMMSNAVFQFLG